MTNFLTMATFCAALLVCAAPASIAASQGAGGLEAYEVTIEERLKASAGAERIAVLQEIILLAHNDPDALDRATLLPVLLTVARDGESGAVRIMAAQAIAGVGVRRDARALRQVATQEHDPAVRRQVLLAAKSLRNR
jgi:hypothetical protein